MLLHYTDELPSYFTVCKLEHLLKLKKFNIIIVPSAGLVIVI